MKELKIFLALALLLLLALLAQGQQSNIVYGTVGDYGLNPINNSSVTVTLLSPNPRQINNTLVRINPMQVNTATNGSFAYTNLQWGFYMLSIAGQPGTVFRFNVWTNTVGSVPIGSLITNTATYPPNPATNYYTVNQVNALLTGIGGGTTNFWGNDVAGKTNQGQVTLYLFIATPPYTTNNYTHWITETN